MLHIWKCFIFICIFATIFSAKLPSNFGRCNKTDFDCLKEKMEDALSKMANGNYSNSVLNVFELSNTTGIKELSIPKLDPFLLPLISIRQRPGAVSLTQNYTNTKLGGMSNIRVKAFRLNLENDCKLHLEVLVPKVMGSTHYDFDGQILTLPLTATGDMKFVHENFEFHNNITCEIYKEKGDDHLRFTDVQTSFIWGRPQFELGDIFKGNPALSKQIENSINEDPSIFIESFEPELHDIWKTIVQGGANQFFSQVPLKEVFLNY